MISVLISSQEKRCILARVWVWMGLSTRTLPLRARQDATSDYPQSGAAAQVFCLRASTFSGRALRNGAGCLAGPACQWPSNLFGMSTAPGGLRPAEGAAFRLCAGMGHGGVLCVRAAAGAMSGVRHQGGAGALGARQ